MENLKEAVKKEIEERYKRVFDRIEEANKEELETQLRNYNREYKKNPKEKLLRFLEKRKEQEIKDRLSHIDRINKAEDFKGRLIISVEWKKSYMWGKNPRCETNTGFKGSSVGGCGYDKLSTSVKEALNNDERILKLLYIKKNENIKTVNGVLFGYGSGYGILPYFEGGVGVGCYPKICESIGLKFERIVNTNNTDVFIIEKKD